MHIQSEHIVPRVIELFESTCVKQFESLDQDIELVTDQGGSIFEGDDLHYASIKALSEDLETSLVISVPRAALEVTIPGDVKHLDNYGEFLEDWNLELANRIMGRLKNKLISHECVLKMGIPQPCDKEQASSNENAKGEGFAYHYSVQDIEFRCHLSINMLNPKMVMEEHEDEDEDWFDESELLHL